MTPAGAGWKIASRWKGFTPLKASLQDSGRMEQLLPPLQEVEGAAQAAIFRRLSAYVLKQHSLLLKKQGVFRATHSRYRILPTVYAVSGTLNPADHADTLPALADGLRKQVEQYHLLVIS